MIAIIDYGVGNIFSLYSSFRFIGANAVLTSDKKEIEKSDKIILPGVGAFRDAAAKLRETGLADIVCDEVKKGKPMLGICLGMQMLLDKSYEYGEYQGLGLIKGNIKPIKPIIPDTYKVPQIGWNGLHFPKSKNELFKYVNEGEHVYFVHSYHATDCDNIIATTEYGAALTASVARDNVYGTQFHPEKSGEVGLNILRAFDEI